MKKNMPLPNETWEHFPNDPQFIQNSNLNDIIIIFNQKTRTKQNVMRNDLIMEIVHYMLHQRKYMRKIYSKTLDVVLDETFSTLFYGYKQYYLYYEESINCYRFQSVGSQYVQNKYILTPKFTTRNDIMTEIQFQTSHHLWERDFMKKITFYPCGRIQRKEWGFDEKLCRKNSGNPSKVIYFPDGSTYEEYFYHIDGRQSNLRFPSYIKYFRNGEKQCEKWYLHNHLHRENAPALIRYDQQRNETVEYWHMGKQQFSGILGWFLN